MKPTAVIFDHDGGIDDLLSLILLLTMPEVEVKAVTITPADCYLDDATESTLKILSLFGRQDIVVGQGTLHGINAFPADWRAQPRICNALPRMLNTPVDTAPVDPRPAHILIADLLAAAEQPHRLLMTGPCSNLTAALEYNPNAANNIADVTWMGGAVEVRGNVTMHNQDGSAEWNVFWDPAAAAKLIEMGLNLNLIPLDATNQLPVDRQFLQRLAGQSDYPLSDLAGQFWAATVTALPCYEYTYFMWDVLATAYLSQPALFDMQDMTLQVIEKGAQQGNTVRVEGAENNVRVACKVNADKVIDYVLDSLKHQISK